MLTTLARSIRSAPLHFVIGGGITGLAVGAAAAVFAVVDGVLFESLPYPEPDRVYIARGVEDTTGRVGFLSSVDVELIGASSSSIAVAAIGVTATTLTHPHRPDREFTVYQVGRRFFQVLGQRPAIGGFSEAHFADWTRDGVWPVVVSHGFWQNELGGEEPILGRTVNLIERQVRVVGVMPEDFVFPQANARFRTAMLTPLRLPDALLADRWARELLGVVRLAPTLAREEAEERIAAQFAQHDYGGREARLGVGPYSRASLQEVDEALSRLSSSWFRAAFGSTLLLVGLASLSVAALTAGRLFDRRHELALRMALGATPWDIRRLLLLEAAVVALAGGVAGIVLAVPAIGMTLHLVPESLPLIGVPVVDWRVVAFALATPCVTLGMLGFASARCVARWRSRELLQGEGIARRRPASWSVLLAASCAVGVALVIPATLAAGSFVVLRTEDVGFEPEHLAVIQFRSWNDAPLDLAAVREISSALARGPAVAGVGVLSSYFYEGIRNGTRFGAPVARGFDVEVSDIPVSAEVFSLLGLDSIEGRLPSATEFDEGQRVAVVSRTVAEAYWPNDSAVGKVLSSDEGQAVVLGVVDDVNYVELGRTAPQGGGEIYVPFTWRSSGRVVFLVSCLGDPDSVVATLAAEIESRWPDLTIRRALSVDALLGDTARRERFQAIVMTFAGGVALVSLAIGIIGLVLADVRRRHSEIAVRIALGATPFQVRRLLTSALLIPVVLGLAVGSIAAWWVVGLVESLLYGLSAVDVRFWAGAVVGLAAVSGMAAWLAASGAGRLEPAQLLRSNR